MRRMSSPILLLVVLTAPLVSSAGQGPPSSMAPTQRGTVTFSHDAIRVVACSAKRDKQDRQKITCLEKSDAMDATTSITLNPIAAEGLGAKDKREKMQIRLPKDGGTPVKLDVAAGTWELEWPGKTERDRFYVADADEFAIDLKTQFGSCKRVGDECVLRTEKAKLDVRIPKRCQR